MGAEKSSSPVKFVFKIYVAETQSITASYLQECNEEKEGIGCPPELWVEEPGKEGDDVIFGGAEGHVRQETRPHGGWGSKRKRNKWLDLKI